jgi:glycosyltransferase involved in cell wall biosynthesis
MFVYPSLFEGFGIPILEALTSGIPVIAAKGSCLEEAGGPHSLYFQPHDEIELTASIAQILADKSLKNEMIKNGNEFALKFSDENIAKNLQEVYHKTIQDSNL